MVKSVMQKTVLKDIKQDKTVKAPIADCVLLPDKVCSEDHKNIQKVLRRLMVDEKGNQHIVKYAPQRCPECGIVLGEEY